MVNICFQVPIRDTYREKRQIRCIFAENWSKKWRNLEKKPRNIAIGTDYGNLTLHILPGSKSRQLYRKKAIQMYFCWKLITELKKSWKKPRNIAIGTDYGELTLHMLPGCKSRQLYRKKGKSDVFLLKIDQRIEEILKIKPRKIACK